MKTLVCGGRDYCDKQHVFSVLDGLHQQQRIDLVIHGGASGADFLADQWAVDNEIPRSIFKADWSRHGRSAGPIRNLEMLLATTPDLVIAFPGGKGTANMVAIAKRHGFSAMCVQRTP